MNEKDFYREIGKKYRELRESKGIKLIDAADNAGIDNSELSRFERQGKKISAFRLNLLLQAINATMEDLTGENNSEKKTKLILKFPGSTPELSPA